MNKILPFILTTAIGFAVGILAGIWIKQHPCIPPPPAAVLDELKNAPMGSGNPAPQTAVNNPNYEQALQQIKEEMDDFRKKVDTIKSSVRSQMDPILTPEQLERVRKWRERPAPPRRPSDPPPAPGSRGRSARSFYENLDSAMTIIMVPFSLERLDDSLKFSPEQKEAVRKLLIERREKFLELVDETPPPSFKLLKLAPPEAKKDPTK